MLRFIWMSLQRNVSTFHDTKFTRLTCEVFTEPLRIKKRKKGGAPRYNFSMKV